MLRSWRAALINMNTMLQLEPRMPRVLMLSKLIFMLPGAIADCDEAPTVEIYQEKDLVLDTADDGVDVEWVGGTLAVTVNRIISHDIQIRVLSYERTSEELVRTRTMSSISEDGDESPLLRNRMVARCAFHTSQFPAGALVVGHERLDIFTDKLVNSNEVELQLILHDAPPATVERMKEDHRLKADQIANLTGSRAQSVGAKHFTTHHDVFPEATPFNTLVRRVFAYADCAVLWWFTVLVSAPQLAEGHEETVVVAALQRTQNTLEAAREMVTSPYLLRVAAYTTDTTDTDCTSPVTDKDLKTAAQAFHSASLFDCPVLVHFIHSSPSLLSFRCCLSYACACSLLRCLRSTGGRAATHCQHRQARQGRTRGRPRIGIRGRKACTGCTHGHSHAAPVQHCSARRRRAGPVHAVCRREPCACHVTRASCGHP